MIEFESPKDLLDRAISSYNQVQPLLLWRQRALSSCLVAVVVLSTALSGGCVGAHSLAQRPTAAFDPVTWFSPVVSGDARALTRWRVSVGPPVIRRAPVAGVVADTGPITVVSWNIAVGDADVVEFVRRLRAERGAGVPLVILLQEAYRTSADVPVALDRTASFASRLGRKHFGGQRSDIEAIAEATGLNVYYVPSMRNGGPGASTEDRGNAVLSTFPLNDLAAIELPFERQRRVAVAATVSGLTAGGQPWRLRVVSAHLDNIVGPKRLWFAGGELARARQARALVEYLKDDPTALLAGDFNTWFGFVDRAYVETAAAFPPMLQSDRRATFHGVLRLDHMFARLPDGWRADCRRGDNRFGSDHFPLIATLRME